MRILPPPTARQIVLWLANCAKHSDNLTEFTEYLATAWRRVGLPGDLPMDETGYFIDTPEDGTPGAAALEGKTFAALANVVIESEWAKAGVATFISLERSSDVGKVSRAAEAAGLEVYEYRRDVVVVIPEE